MHMKTLHTHDQPQLDIQTLRGRPVSILGLGGRQSMEPDCPAMAYAAGINYFFFYNLSFANLLAGLKPSKNFYMGLNLWL